ncbi:MAG: hypothetical protein Q9225_003989, partial [Loekoesia sp. 1 TL-2023]
AFMVAHTQSKKQALMAAEHSARAISSGNNEDWEQVQDAKQRKKIQNRIAQRSYRKRIKQKLEGLEQWQETVAAAIADPPPTATSDAELNSSKQSNENTQQQPSTNGPRSTVTTVAPQMSYVSQSPLPWNPSLDPFFSLHNIGEGAITGVDLAATLDPRLQCQSHTCHDAQRLSLGASPRTSRCTEMDLDKNETTKAGSALRDPNGEVSKARGQSQQILRTHLTLLLEPDEGKTALHLAAERGETKIARTLLERMPNPDVQDQSGYTPLILAVQNNHEDMVKLLLEKRRNVNLQDQCGQTALHAAITEANENIVGLLLQADVDLELKDYSGRAALHIAAQIGNERVLQQLLDKGADVVAKVG